MSSEKSGDALRGPAAPAAARRRRPAPAGALAHRPGPRLRGADAPRGGGHAAAGGLRGPRVPPAAAALHRLRAGLPCGRALCRRDPGGAGSPLHAARAAAGPGAGPAGAQAPAARLHAHRSADHHLLLLAHGHHRYFQGGAGAHGPWRAETWCRPRSPRARRGTSPSSPWRWASRPWCSAPSSPWSSSSPRSTTRTTGIREDAPGPAPPCAPPPQRGLRSRRGPPGRPAHPPPGLPDWDAP